MINESYIWKNELLKISNSLKHKMKLKKWYQKSYFSFEKNVFMAFYIIRKLLDANKLSSIYNIFELSCYIIPNNGKNVTRLNNHRIHELYDFSKMNKSKIKLRDLCNQIIHSHVFSTLFDELNYLTGFFVSSDSKRNKHLVLIYLKDFIEILNLLGNDYPNTASYRYNDDIKDYTTIQLMVNTEEENNKFDTIINKFDNKDF